MDLKTIIPSSKITVSSRGQLVIPKEVRDACGIHGGTEILVRTREDGVIELRPLKRKVGDLFIFKGTPRVTAGAVDVDSSIAEAVEADDARTKRTGGAP
ncbi:MAG: AbrB/MazE/SpoVT family DNA-binding domain-containing protein [Proteobacteria bacterium]|nr:AbrB/MazE/SpoVT family DNA-binding domain-containing protein [Pseudomonadota bacterium]